MMPLLIEALNASLIGILSSVLLWMWCRRRIYSWRDFGIVLLLLTSVLIRLTHPNPPASHFIGIMLLNVIFVLVAALVWARPSKIPPCEKQADCIIVRAWNWIANKRRTHVTRNTCPAA